MGSASGKTFNVLVIGPRGAGKTHFLDMFVHGNDSTKFHTIGFYETCIPFWGNTIHFYECAQLGCLETKRITYDLTILVMVSGKSYEYYQRAKNMLFSVLRSPKVCLLYNVIDSRRVTGEEDIFQISQLSKRAQVSVIEIDISDQQHWAQATHRLLEWLTGA